jgi:hypothetical protein
MRHFREQQGVVGGHFRDLALGLTRAQRER